MTDAQAKLATLCRYKHFVVRYTDGGYSVYRIVGRLVHRWSGQCCWASATATAYGIQIDERTEAISHAEAQRLINSNLVLP